MSNYATQAALPGPFRTELLDVITEECVEVLQSLKNLREATAYGGAKVVEAASAEVA